MIKQMANHRDCHDERMSNLINHHLSDRQHRNGNSTADFKWMSDPPGSGSSDKTNMYDCMQSFRDCGANLKASGASVGSTDASRTTTRCRGASGASHTTPAIRLKPANEDDWTPRRWAADGDSNAIYVNYNCKSNQIDKQNVNHRLNSTYGHCSPTMAKRQATNSSSFRLLTLLTFTLTLTLVTAQTSVTFEKLTNRDYSGFTYYTIRNVSLYECLGMCSPLSNKEFSPKRFDCRSVGA